MTKYYDQKYFDWQQNIGTFGGMANLFKFKDYIKETDTVVDFGCGGGDLLANINAKEKIGVEINDSARESAKKYGIKTVKYATELKDESIDVIVSNHALEHVLNPYEELQVLKNKLKKNGKIIFVIPHEIKVDYKPNDVNQHLFTWSPMCAGNLFNAVGFKVEKVETLRHTWPPYYYQIRKYFGQSIFDLSCSVYSILFAKTLQTRVVAIK